MRLECPSVANDRSARRNIVLAVRALLAVLAALAVLAVLAVPVVLMALAVLAVLVVLILVLLVQTFRRAISFAWIGHATHKKVDLEARFAPPGRGSG